MALKNTKKVKYIRYRHEQLPKFYLVSGEVGLDLKFDDHFVDEFIAKPFSEESLYVALCLEKKLKSA